MECKFRKRKNNEQGVITLDGQQIPITECFKYLGSIIQKDREIDGDVNHRIKSCDLSGEVRQEFCVTAICHGV